LALTDSTDGSRRAYSTGESYSASCWDNNTTSVVELLASEGTNRVGVVDTLVVVAGLTRGTRAAVLE